MIRRVGSKSIAVDGKTCRGSHRRGEGLGPLHIVSVWASEERVALGQVVTDARSNEITAIPELLENLILKDALVSIDAMGCHHEIVEKIDSKEGDFVIAVKDNQPKLHAAIEAFFNDRIEMDVEEIGYDAHQTLDKGHGRVDERACYVADVPKGAPFDEWQQVKAIGYAIRLSTKADGTEGVEVRYYILSRRLTAKRFAESVRGHWSIESMHWVLDVTLRGDESRTKERNLGNNLSLLRRFAVSLLKRHPLKDSIKGKMQRCSYSTAFLEEVLVV